MFCLLFLAAAFASADTMACATPQNLLQNCGFEDLSWWHTGGNWDTGWNAVSSPGAHHSGATALKLGNAPNQNVAGVWNYIVSEPGVDYTLSFWLHLSANNNQGGDQQFFLVGWGGTSPFLLLYNQPASDPDNPWTFFTFTRTGNGLREFFQICGYSNAGYIYVDDVTLRETSSATPEPATLSLLLSGLFGVAGRRIYRRRT